MFKVAQYFVRHKVLTLGIVGVAAFTFMGNQPSEEEQKPDNPWSKQSVSVASLDSKKDDDSMLGQVTDKAMAVAGEYLGESVGIDPVELKDQTVGNWDGAASAYEKANKGER
ncbi:hypothetical protein GCM10011371_13410 [Novosphingobium marinum]|uniref:Uncharacterized protein n=1 Tax=Novosphingobium marinum TaxID=1514948 RepID=A0A7Z0BTS0_9SPHN|nr:hypothetical protein [Novosphingobium marinum]NYH95449.1 hypothetical protein [Novosphingobium marinum]GGC27156.1 hypothetical protein GCM10011371_13410 [Novosphingobium marinum]